jgi:hypothetical protein
VKTWDIAYFIEYLKPKLPVETIEFLTALVDAMNDRAKRPEMEKFQIWREATPQTI